MDIEHLVQRLPVGYRYSPRDTEIIVFYLINKLVNRPPPNNAIKDIDFYAFDPDQLPISSFAGYCRPNEAYFFTEEVRGRTTKNGHWEASGPEEPVMYEDKIVGFKRPFVYYAGEEETNWIVHEYRVNPDLIPANAPNTTLKSKIDSFVICKIQYKEENEQVFDKENTSSLGHLDDDDDV